MANQDIGITPLTFKEKRKLTGDLQVSSRPEHFEAAKHCYINSFAKLGFDLLMNF